MLIKSCTPETMDKLRVAFGKDTISVKTQWYFR